MTRKYMPIKEDRGWYFVEYYPPPSDTRLAGLSLVVVTGAPPIEVASVMEKELAIWLARYPVPLMVSAFDNKEDHIDLGEVRPSNHLVGFYEEDGKLSQHWKLLKDEEIPDIALDQNYLDNLYAELNFRTFEEMDNDRKKRRKQIISGQRILLVGLVLWLAVIPAAWAIAQNFSSLLSWIVTIFSVYKATQKGLELTGKWPKSKKQKQEEETERLKDHYYYHCQMNPEGFDRLKIENMERMQRDQIEKEAESLKRSTT